MPETIDDVVYYTVEEFAAVVGVSKSTIERRIADQKLRYWQISTGSAIRIPSTELKRLEHPRQ